MKNLISRIQRELPDTDKDRYDVAHERGKSEVRGGLLFGGLAFGAIVGAALTFLFDPNRGSDRRAQLASRATDLRNDLVRTATSRVEELQNRTKGPAIATAEPGYRAPEEGVPAHSTTRRTGQRSKASRGTSNGTAVAGLPLDDDSPGANIPDPLTSADTQAGWDGAEREAQRASEGHAAG